jgi:hypothetical protein
MRILVFLHRYLGVVVGVLMTSWCLSGFVMMYSPYPQLTNEQRIAALAPLQFAQCCALERIPAAALQASGGFRVQMLGARPVLRLAGRGAGSFDLRSGAPLQDVSEPEALQVAEGYARAHGIGGSARSLGRIASDQWTVEGSRGRAPLFHIAFDDAAANELYVASDSGELLQHTTRAQRFWGWLGAVPHWLYPTVLRANGALWASVVVWTSLLGCFLTVAGLWLGTQRWLQRPHGRNTPYLGLWKWHHISGLLFGLLTLTWVASGLFSMQPWGFLDSDAGIAERRQLAGHMDGGQLRELLATAIRATPRGSVEIAAAPLAGKPYFIARRADASVIRFAADGAAAALQAGELQGALQGLGALREFGLLQSGDDYYYAHHSDILLPVYRAILDDPGHTRLYVDPRDGALLRALDPAQRSYRWLQNGLHSLDFAGLRARPLWDVVTLALLAGVTFGCCTGTWMAWRRLRRDGRWLIRLADRQRGGVLDGAQRETRVHSQDTR